MAKFTTSVDDYLILPATVGLPLGMERRRHQEGRRGAVTIPVRLILDTGSKRSTLQPRVLDRLDPEPSLSVRLTTTVDDLITRLYWVRLEFPEADLFSIGHLEVARAGMPFTLAEFDGVLGRDVLRRWESLHWQGRVVS